MKAYYLSTSDYDDGMAVVFADNPSQAKKQIYSTDIWYEGYWTDLRVRRANKFDGMEKLSVAELDLKKWRDGWQWLDMDYPDVDMDTDEDFLAWHKKTFKEDK